MSNIITVSGNFGYVQYRPSLADGTTIDASEATFLVDKNLADDGKALPSPVSIRDAADIEIFGGTVLGLVDQKEDREVLYDQEPKNSTSVYARDAEDIHIHHWRIDNVWDGIRTSYNSDGFLIENVWITDTRDDAIENDKLNTGTYRDSLFDGVWSGISLDPGTGSDYDGAGKTVTIDGVLIRMKEYLNDGRMIHYSPLKPDRGVEMPDLRITNSVFAIEDVNHGGLERLAYAWKSLVESSGNVFLNLSDEPLPSTYPLPPFGWTVLQGQQARDYWKEVRDDWVARHADMALTDDDVPASGSDPEPDPDPAPEPAPGTAATFDGENFKGDASKEIIIGNSKDNRIDGGDGDDSIYGGAGNDVIRGNDGSDQLWGGTGKDVFLFTSVKDSRVENGIDTIKDFRKGEDKIDLRQIDANWKASGDQAFKLTDGLPGIGELDVYRDASTGTTVIDANVDRDSAIEFTIRLAGDHNLTAEDFLL